MLTRDYYTAHEIMKLLQDKRNMILMQAEARLHAFMLFCRVQQDASKNLLLHKPITNIRISAFMDLTERVKYNGAILQLRSYDVRLSYEDEDKIHT